MLSRIYLLGLVFVLGVGGCSSDGNERREEYLDADYYKRLELPPDLTAPETSKQLVSPKPTSEAIEQFELDSAEVGKFESNLAVPVGIKVKGARMQISDGVIWLEVDESPETLWPKLKGFWDNEGLAVIREERLLGFMETDYTRKLNIFDDTNFMQRVLLMFDPPLLDKFRMRIELDASGTRSRIFVAHSGLEKVSDSANLNENLDDSSGANWRVRQSDEELEREMLTRLALYVGLDKQQAAEVYAEYRPFASRVHLSEDGTNEFYVDGDIDVVWKRLLRYMDRIGIAILEKDENSYQLKVVVAEQLTDKALEVVEDELSESSWLMNLYNAAPEEGYEGDLDREFIVKLKPDNAVVRIDVLNRDNEPTDTLLAEQFRRALAIGLR